MAGWVLMMASSINSSMVESSTCSSPLCTEKRRIKRWGSQLCTTSLLCLFPPALPPYLPGLQLGKHRQAEIWTISEGPGNEQPLFWNFLQADFQLWMRVKGAGLRPASCLQLLLLARTLPSQVLSQREPNGKAEALNRPLPNSVSHVPFHLCCWQCQSDVVGLHGDGSRGLLGHRDWEHHLLSRELAMQHLRQARHGGDEGQAWRKVLNRVSRCPLGTLPTRFPWDFTLLGSQARRRIKVKDSPLLKNADIHTCAVFCMQL